MLRASVIQSTRVQCTTFVGGIFRDAGGVDDRKRDPAAPNGWFIANENRLRRW